MCKCKVESGLFFCKWISRIIYQKGYPSSFFPQNYMPWISLAFCSIKMRMVSVNTLTLFPVLEGEHSVFPAPRIMVALGFCRCCLWLREISCFSWCAESLNQCWILSDVFSASFCMLKWFFFWYGGLCWLIFKYIMIHIPWPKNKSYLVVVYYFYIHCWIWFTKILLRIFVPKFMRNIDL